MSLNDTPTIWSMLPLNTSRKIADSAKIDAVVEQFGKGVVRRDVAHGVGRSALVDRAQNQRDGEDQQNRDQAAPVEQQPAATSGSISTTGAAGSTAMAVASTNGTSIRPMNSQIAASSLPRWISP